MKANIQRCRWIEGKPDYYVDYHDHVWCVPKHDDQELFRWLILESFHVGLSWQLILSKYDNFMEAFDQFDYRKIADYDEAKLNRLMEDPGIIRHRGKIEAAVANAQAFQQVQADQGSFNEYIWSFTDGQVVERQGDEMLNRSPLSDEVTISLKKYGFKFIGSVTIYSYLQAIGVINDHDADCSFRSTT